MPSFSFRYDREEGDNARSLARRKCLFAPFAIPHLTGGSQVPRLPLSSLIKVPLVCSSFIFFRVVRKLLLRLRNARDRGHESLRWRTLSEALDQPLALPYVMVTGPRWNPHALIASVGPFQLTQRLRIRVDTARRAAQMWTLVIYSTADSRTITAIDSSVVADSDVWYEHTIPPGRYTGILRYYEWSAMPMLPALEIDDQQRVPERAVSTHENDYLTRIRDKHGMFYAGLHYYMVEVLRLRYYLPEAFIRREYLPVGNPETAFYHGYLQRGQCVEITSSQGIPNGYRLYLTIYNRSSFPVFWSTVESLPYRTSPAENTGSYLLRLHAQGAIASPIWPAHLLVTTW